MACSKKKALSFMVRRQPAVLVPPAGRTPRELKWLSDIDDQEGLRYHESFLCVYRGGSSNNGGRDPAAVLKAAIAGALVHYYPLAGRLRELEGRKLAVECTGEGVLFVEADAQVRLDLEQFMRPPFPQVKELVCDVPALLDAPLVLVQVTRLACGATIVAFQFQHSMMDGAGMEQFLIAVAELARGAPAPTVRPAWGREALLAREVPRPSFAHPAYQTGEGSIAALDDAEMAHRCFFFGPREVAAVRAQLTPDLRERATAFDIVAGSLWKCRAVALARASKEQERLMFTVNLRYRKQCRDGIPSGYYGNAFSLQVAATAAGELCANPVGHAVRLVNEAKAGVDMEYMQSLADLLVQRGRPSFHLAAGTYLLSDITKMGFGKLDFGWGMPLFGGPTGVCHIPGNLSYLIGSAGAEEGEGVLVPMCLPRLAMEKFGKEMGKLLHPAVQPA